MNALTDLDRRTIARARELADLKGTDAIRKFTGQDEGGMAVAAALGTAQELLWQLARLAEAIDRIVGDSQPGMVTLTADQAVVVVRALGDATEYRRRHTSDWCSSCEGNPAGACDDHLDDLDQADAYQDLAAKLTCIPPGEGDPT